MGARNRNRRGAEMTKADHKTNGVRGFEACAAHEILSMTELPPPNTRRWVPRRKAAVVAAVSSGLITIEEACRRYHMSEEEFLAWRCAFQNFGIRGLRAGRIQRHRSVGLSRAGDP